MKNVFNCRYISAQTIGAVCLMLVTAAGCRTTVPTDNRTLIPTSPLFARGYQGEVEAEYTARGRVGFCCNRWKDINKNGSAEFPREYIGIKNRFTPGEPLTLMYIINDLNLADKECKVNIVGPRGNNIEQAAHNVPAENAMIQMAGGEESLSEWLMDISGPGLYKATWAFDGKIQGYCEFEIVPAEKQTAEQPPPPEFYVVEKGDTLYGIAAANNTTIAELKKLNGLKSSKILVNQKLRLR